MNKRANNINIFNDTQKMCETNQILKEAIKHSNSNQYMFAEHESIDGKDSPRFKEPARIIVSGKRSLEAASFYAYNREKVCVHNFASATSAGGGVVNGSSAQEEAICRCSTLYFNLCEKEMADEFYQQHRKMLSEGKMDATYNDDCIFTPGVKVFKSDTDSPETLPEKEWYSVDVITCAAPNLRERPGNPMNPGSGRKSVKLKDSELLELHVKRVSRILDIARYEKADVVILGAFGCGAFCNPPKVVAETMARVASLYRNDFKTIEFAVYCPPGDTENYDVFYRRLHNL